MKSRILALRQMCESSPESVDYEDQCAYDVADMVKQFFRDLPEPLLTSKMGETFLHIYQCKCVHNTRSVRLLTNKENLCNFQLLIYVYSTTPAFAGVTFQEQLHIMKIHNFADKCLFL